MALHTLIGAALLSHEPARSALAAAAPIMVELITPPEAAPQPEPPIEIPPLPKPKPRPKAKAKPVVKPPPKLSEPEPPLVATPVELPAPPIATPAKPPEPPQPEPAIPPPPPEPPVALAPPAPPPPVPVTAPIFNADYLRNPPPAYPALSKRIGEEGRVVLRVLVTTAGKPGEIQVSSSSGHSRLDQAAREAVARWQFVPAKRGEDPVAAWVLVPISFRLEG